MEKTKLQMDFPVETYGGVDDQRVTQPEDTTEELTLAELLQLMKTPNHEIPQRIRLNYGGVDGLCSHLLTSADTGLRNDDPSDLDRRRRKFGSNSIPPRKRKSFCHFLWDAIQDTTLIILIIAAIISLGLSFYTPPTSSTESADTTGESSGFIEGIGILVAVVIIVMVTAGINYNKDAQFRGLQKQMTEQYKSSVVRSGSVVQLSTSELVVGDICLVEYGDAIPADGVLIRGNDLRLDESSHSGESKDIVKDIDTDPILYSGTHVIEGSGKMVVTGVGLNSAKGIIFSLLGATDDDDDESEPEEKKSPLHKKLSSLAMQIAYIGTSIAVLTFLILMLRFCIDVFFVQEKPWSHAYVQDFVSFVIISITILVVAVPEGLPLAVILALVYSIKKMVNDNNLVRHLDACEVMGHATTILCDKTGTLTTNKMTVVRSYVSGFTHDNASSLRHLPEDMKLLIASSISNNTSYKTQLQGTGKLVTQLGNRTECALLGFVSDLGYDYRHLRERTPEKSFVKVFPFTSAKKWMGTVVPKSDDSTNDYRLFVKGAWEVVLTRCRWIMDSNSEVTELTDERRTKIEEEFVEPMSTNGLRVLAIAYKDFSQVPETLHEEKMATAINWDAEDESICCRLVLLAIVGIEDPVRTEVPEAVRKCQKAGITVRMVTGDHMDTARFVAIKCGIFNPGEDHLTLDGPEFNQRIRNNEDSEKVDQNLFDQLWPRLRILARSSPLDKYNLVKGIMSCPVDHDRQIVAVTGDGTNDGPALRQAHVGLAMGVTGTDVAKEASDIILLDDNFSSIVKAVVWGRHVYDSIAKFVQFQLTVNVVAVALALVGACVIMDSPLKGIQMLWVNLLMDSLASLSLATEHPTNDVLLRRPYGSSQHLVSGIMATNILSHSLYELTILLTILFIGADWLDIDDGKDPSLRGVANSHYTFLFNAFVMMILFNEINARKIDGNQNVFSGILSSPIFIVIWLASFVIQVIIVEVGGSVFYTVKLTWDQWMWSIFLGISDLLYGQAVTFLWNIYNRRRKVRTAKGNELDLSQSSSVSTGSENTEFEMSSADSTPLYDASTT